MIHPELFVFDLDFTLWDCGGLWCDHTQPPYVKGGHFVFDSRERCLSLYPDVPDILQTLSQQGIRLALASRTSKPDWAQKLIHLFDIGKYFSYSEIYPGSKITHFERLREKTALPYSAMIFFDDESRNIHEVSSLGVKSVIIPRGLEWKHIPGFAQSRQNSNQTTA
ncbi:MAG: magnesium-dependent phosphatase-1 [Spirochaetales bacterium]|nr:magnesium-dependent phosphatase-1 [Spirochaetales bacterium]